MMVQDDNFEGVPNHLVKKSCVQNQENWSTTTSDANEKDYSMKI